MLHELSYNFNDAIFSFNNLNFGVQVFTFENVYGLDVTKCTTGCQEHTFTVQAKELSYAGGQQSQQGKVNIVATKGNNKTTIKIEAQVPKTIRSTKLLLKNIPYGSIINLIDKTEKEVPAQGLILRYPEGWRTLATPLLIMKTNEGKLLYFRSLDNKVRDKRFVFIRRGKTIDVELIFEEDATSMEQDVTIPEWEIGTCNSIEEIYKIHIEHIEKCYSLEKWEKRKDVPQWAREISLVASIHCQHWTGYIFNDYQRILDNLKWLAERIEPKRILAYLPGWEGRYYWKYGNYTPDDRMGGVKGFDKLVTGAKDLGVRVMPMFGINIVNRGSENYEEWGSPSEFRSPSGNRYDGSVDWDSSRHYDQGFGANLNPAAPKWQNRLVSQITNLIDSYGVDGVFLDIAAVWVNDPNHSLYPGILKLVERIRENRPDVLVSGEAWYDGLAKALPLVQSGHTDGVLHWFDDVYAEIFDRYCRAFGHLCLGDPGRGSTGVHELGFNPIQRVPVRKGIIPTITMVEDTIERAPEKVEKIISDAKKYAELYLK
jgi:hypothetical protein